MGGQGGELGIEKCIAQVSGERVTHTRAHIRKKSISENKVYARPHP